MVLIVGIVIFVYMVTGFWLLEDGLFLSSISDCQAPNSLTFAICPLSS
jgi:hypothetical protein